MDASQDEFLALTLEISRSGPEFLTELGPMIVVSALLQVAGDTRSFARKFEVPHALVLREAVHLDETLGILVLDDQSDKSGRMFWALTDSGQRMCEAPA